MAIDNSKPVVLKEGVDIPEQTSSDVDERMSLYNAIEKQIAVLGKVLDTKEELDPVDMAVCRLLAFNLTSILGMWTGKYDDVDFNEKERRFVNIKK